MALKSITISARITLNLHNMNNEGSEGNHQQTRMVTVATPDGQLHSVNAISGDMFKHMIAQHLQAIAAGRNLPLCEGCKKFNANRIGIDQNFEEFAKEKTKEDGIEIINEILNKCAIDDILGIMFTGQGEGSGKHSIARKSVIETGWIVGIPEQVRTESFLHVKYVPERGKGKGESSNVGQNLFHRPTNSGVYALVINIDFDRIGFNDITRTYPVEIKDRKERALALLDAVIVAIVKLTGAQRGTQLPHITSFDGIIATSQSTIPAPSFSPLSDNFKEEIKKIGGNLNKIEKDKIKTRPAESLDAAVDILIDLRDQFSAGERE
ncbi:MAG: DevR family CRISPR-associated autoregulator [Petrotogales bacterium]